MRHWRLALLVLAGMVAAAAATVLAIAVNVLTGDTEGRVPLIEAGPQWWTSGSTVVVAAAGLLVWWVQRWYERGLVALVPVAQRPESWVVDRPAVVGVVVRALRRRGGASTVGVTTAVHGAGGFGKSTVARMVRADRRVLRRFGGRVYWVTLGRDARRGALVEKVNDLVRQIDPAQAQQFTDVQQAAEHLAKVLVRGPRRLIILDDVWFDDQLAVFPVAGRCVRLVTTRIPTLVAGSPVAVKVDQMSADQARAVLTAGLPALPASVVNGLMVEAGRWPLLLRLVNKVLVAQCRLRTDAGAVAQELLLRLRRDGALQVDELTGAAGRVLDVGDPDQRRQAVAATIEASTGLLSAGERELFTELAIFVEDEMIPVALIATLWRATAGVDAVAARALCARLGDLALLASAPTDTGGTVSLHDVVRDFLRGDLGTARLRELNDVLLRGVAADLPMVGPVVAGDDRGEVTAWWRLPDSARYLWDHLIEHLIAAGRSVEADTIVADLRWVAARLEQSGTAGPFADLAHVGTTRAARLGRLFGQTAHLLAPTVPAHSRIDVLFSRVAHDPDWGHQVTALAAERALPALVNGWPLPDTAHPGLRRMVIGHTGRVNAVAIAPDGGWLVTASNDKSARIWDATTGQQRTTLTGHTGWVTAVAIAPNGTWLATTNGDDGSVRIWDTTTGRVRTTLAGPAIAVTAVAIGPDGSWLATTSTDSTVRIWDAATGQQRTTVTGHHGAVTGVAIAPDGTWLASAGDDRSVRIWDTTTGRQRTTLTGHTRPARTVAIAPDGTWLASAGDDRSVRIWDTTTGRQRTTLTGHTRPVNAVAIAPDGTWLATTGDDRSVRIWDTTTHRCRTILTGHNSWVTAVAIAPDGTWLATTGDDGSVRIWDTTTDQDRSSPTGHTRPVNAVASAPDGTWLASAGNDGSVQIVDAASGQHRTTLTGHTRTVNAVAISPDGTWLASAGNDGSVRIWDATSGRHDSTATVPTHPLDAGSIVPDDTWLASTSNNRSVRIWSKTTAQHRTALTGHTDRVRAVAIAPDGTWLASAGNDGSVRIWDAGTGQHRTTLASRNSAITGVAIAPDGIWLATTSNDRLVRIWDTSTGQHHTTLTGHTRSVTAVAIAPDGTWLATTSNDQTVQIWDTMTGRHRKTLTSPDSAITAVAIAPDCNWLATTGDDGSVRIWRPSGEEAAALMRLEAAAYACVWSPCGRWVTVGGEGGLYRFEFSAKSS